MDLRKLIIEWDNRYPLDRQYRKKYNIAFNSPQHREIKQLDIYLEWLEEKIYEDAIIRANDEIEKEKLLKQGKWLRDTKHEEQEVNDLFDKIDVSSISSDSPIQFVDE